MANQLCKFVQMGFIWRNWQRRFLTVGGTRYEALIFCTIHSPQFKPTHHWGPFIILFTLFTCNKSPPNHLNPFTTAQVCWVMVAWVFQVVVVLQTFPAHVSVPTIGSPLLLLSIPVHSHLTRNLFESSIRKSKKQYTKFLPRPISHIKKDYCGEIAARDWIRKMVGQLMQDFSPMQLKNFHSPWQP